jgi:hypothetical protein
VNESRAWLAQARSDFAVGNDLLDRNLPVCHAIAKFQQAVEKSVKGLVVSLAAAKILSTPVGRRHEVDPYVSAMVRLRRSPSRRSLHNAIQRLFGADRRAQIRDLDALVPKWPPPGVPPSRNTEYPYQSTNHEWRSPAQADDFDRSEVDVFRHLAANIVDGCSRILLLARRRAIGTLRTST